MDDMLHVHFVIEIWMKTMHIIKLTKDRGSENLCVEIKLECNPACHQTIIYLYGEEIGFGNEKCQR